MELDVTLKNYRCFSDDRPATFELRNGMTALVGPNNSGKSALLRFFYEFRHAFDLGRTDGTWQNLMTWQRLNLTTPPEVLDFEELFSFLNGRPIEVEIVPRGTMWERWPPTFVVRRELRSVEITVRGVTPRSPVSFASDGTERQLVAGSVRLPFSQFRDAMNSLHNIVYIGAFRNALNRGGESQSYFDIPVGEYFISTWNDCLTGNVKRLNRAAARVVHNVGEIFGFESLTVSAGPGNRSLSFQINGRPLKDHEVGSGLTQVLMVLATVAIKEPSYILIDEPELNLHPSLQVKFLMALASYARDGVLFGTHSVGLARTVADRIFSVQQLQEGRAVIKRYEETQNLSELLGEMSFSAYKDMGFEKILLVEGRTDVKVVQHFLRLLKKDHKVVPVPLGGDAMIRGEAEHELSEITRLCNGVVAVIDSERAVAGAEIEQRRKDFAAACAKLGIGCKVLDRRATENYFPGRAIKAAFPNQNYRELGPCEKLRDVSPAWPKADNWRVASEMTREELMATDLGLFLAGL